MIEKIIEGIKTIDKKLMEDAQDKLDNLTKPRGSLGRLEELAKHIVGITGKDSPVIKNKFIITMAADHGIVKEGVSAFPQEVTGQMVLNFIKGGAAVNILAKHAGAKLIVVDIGVASTIPPHPSLINKRVGPGTKNFLIGPAMSRNEAIKSISTGIEIVMDIAEQGCDIIGTGDMGIGNTTASSAITAVITGSPVNSVTGKGTGISDESLSKKITIIEKALSINLPDKDDPIDVLSKVGGFEIGGIAGIILGAAYKRIPVVIDGFISGASALIAVGIEPKVKEYLIASHISYERGHNIILKYLGLDPLLNLSMRLGEGTGSALGISIADAGIKILKQMATFKNAGVSGP
ncbi:MAG: nicotinate-nucleotide--dimethylbenzimidazole phosphoribosyltransferase [Thermodesulfobacteriota bacterium]|nr:nicotinate-nucleotide--dimethylbenzimidazole phosphoribosyltransferase [Thermodesulfobacteriota bacterium]